MKILAMLLLSLQFLAAAGPGADYLAMKKQAFHAYEHGKPQKAVQQVKAFIASHPESLYAKNLLAVFYYWQGEREKARIILEKIVSKSDFPEAKRLLVRIGRKAKKSRNAKKSVHKSVKDDIAKETHRKDTGKDDLSFMQSYILAHPNDAASRKVLLNYYLSVGDTSHAREIAQELLRIDPDDVETLALVKNEGIEVPSAQNGQHDDRQRDKLVTLLHRYKSEKAYSRFINLYQALTSQNAYLPQYIHLEALEVALELKKYNVARRILLKNDFPSTPHLRQLRALLDRKLKMAYAL